MCFIVLFIGEIDQKILEEICEIFFYLKTFEDIFRLFKHFFKDIFRHFRDEVFKHFFTKFLDTFFYYF